MTFIEMYDLCTHSPKEELLAKLCDWGLIPREGSLFCQSCGNPLRIATDTQAPDGWRWECDHLTSTNGIEEKTKCNFQLSFRKGTLLEKSTFSIFQILGFVSFWVYKTALYTIDEELRMPFKLCIDFAAVCRVVMCFAYLLCPEQLGGPGTVVDVDEAQFGMRLFHRGHYLGGQWLYAAYERGTGKFVLVAVKARNTNLLAPIIQQWILPGTTLVSDIWQTYNCLADESYQHLVANHNITFKGPEPVPKKRCIENAWFKAKTARNIRGRLMVHVRGNLPRYIFLRRCHDLKLDRSLEFFRMAGMLYDPRHAHEDVANNGTTSLKYLTDTEKVDNNDL